jgi:hypothetical protein
MTLKKLPDPVGTVSRQEHVARSRTGTCGTEPDGDMWHGAGREHVARSRAGTCGTEPGGDMWARAGREHVARSRTGTCGTEPGGDMLESGGFCYRMLGWPTGNRS